MAEHIIMDANGMRRTLIRLAHEIAERDENPETVVFVGIRRGGEIVAKRIRDCFSEAEGITLPCGGIDIGMQRDDLVSAFFVPEHTDCELNFSVEDKIVVLCDDVLHTAGASARLSKRFSGSGDPGRYSFWNLSTAAAENCPSVRILWVKTYPPRAANT